MNALAVAKNAAIVADMPAAATLNVENHMITETTAARKKNPNSTPCTNKWSFRFMLRDL